MSLGAEHGAQAAGGRVLEEQEQPQVAEVPPLVPGAEEGLAALPLMEAAGAGAMSVPGRVAGAQDTALQPMAWASKMSAPH